MEANINGNCLRIELSSEENNVVFTMPDGYSYESFILTEANNINYINPSCRAIQGTIYNFPPIRSTSPATITVVKRNVASIASANITIVKFGQIPDAHYFDKAFEPILVTGDDGKKYNVIPSDQFK